MHLPLRRAGVSTGLAVAAAALFVTGAKADYLQEHYLSAGWNYAYSYLGDGQHCVNDFSWSHQTTSRVYASSGPQTIDFDYSSVYNGSVSGNPDGTMIWDTIFTFDNYGTNDTYYGLWMADFTDPDTWYPDGTYEYDGTGNPVIANPHFHVDSHSVCAYDSYQILYGP